MSIGNIQNANNSIISSISGSQSSQTNLTGTVQNIAASFSDYLDELSAQENQSDDLLKRLAAGEDVDLHDLMIASTETDVSFRVAMAIRDKLVEAYKEVMRMTV